MVSARLSRQSLSIAFGWAGVMFLLAQGWHVMRDDAITVGSLALDAAIWGVAGFVLAYVLGGYRRGREGQR